MDESIGLVQTVKWSQNENGVNERRPISLESVKIHVDVQGFTADVVATMKYTNTKDNPIEAIYIFPLDEQAAVYGFQATIDGRTVVAEVQDKQEARARFSDAISNGQHPFLLEESDESSDIFQINVGNLAPRQEAVIEIRFMTELAAESDGRVLFVLPTVLNPRYTPAENIPNDLFEIPCVFTVWSLYAFDFEMKIKAISAIDEISSPSNSLNFKIDDKDRTVATVTLAKPHTFDKDLEVHILTREPCKAQAIVESAVQLDEADDPEGFLTSPVVMLNFFPEFENSGVSGKVVTGEFIFVVDRSGSMGGDRIESAGKTLLLFLKSLPSDCYFNVIGFGSSFVKLYDTSKRYNDKHLKKACHLTESMEADLGGTEMKAPLKWIFSQPLVEGHPRQVFILTDGAVGNVQEVVSLVRKHSLTTRCFTFGVGVGASTALVKGVARAGRGTAEFVVSDKDRLQAKVIKTLKRSLQPMVSDLEIVWDLAEGWSVHQIPSSLPTVFMGDRLVVYGILKPPPEAGQSVENDTVDEHRVSLQGNVAQNTKKLDHSLTFSTVLVKSSGNTEFAVLGIRRLAVKTWFQEKQDLHSDLPSVQEEADIGYIVRVSKAVNVVSKFTACIAVDRESHQRVSGPLLRDEIPEQVLRDMAQKCKLGGFSLMHWPTRKRVQ